MNGYIYLITNNINGKRYVGQTVQIPKRRWSCTISHIHRSNRAISRAIKKYGKDQFSFEILEEVLEDFLNEREIYWIKEMESFGPKGYNMNEGGAGFHTIPEIVRTKISNTHKKLCENPEERMRRTKHRIGSKHTEKTKLIMSEKRKGIKFTEEHKEKLRISRAKYLSNPDNRKKCGYNKGKTVSLEIKNKISIGVKNSVRHQDYIKSAYIVEKIDEYSMYIFDIRKFCLTNNLNQQCLTRTAHSRKHHKGYRVMPYVPISATKYRHKLEDLPICQA